MPPKSIRRVVLQYTAELSPDLPADDDCSKHGIHNKLIRIVISIHICLSFPMRIRSYVINGVCVINFFVRALEVIH